MSGLHASAPWAHCMGLSDAKSHVQSEVHEVMSSGKEMVGSKRALFDLLTQFTSLSCK